MRPTQPIFAKQQHSCNGNKVLLDFGKIDAFYTGRRENLVEIEIELENETRLTLTAKVWNRAHTALRAGGQCNDFFVRRLRYFPLKSQKVIKKLLPIWDKWHLNDMHPGTEEQEACLKEHENEQQEIIDKLNAEKQFEFEKVSPWSYEVQCELLKKYGLFEVIVDGKPYKYGYGWIYRPLPPEIMTACKEMFALEENVDVSDRLIEILKDLP